MSFQSFSLDPRIHAGIEALGYTEPTPIQLQAIPALLRGRDVVGVAQTGTGKTAAFVLPILDRLTRGARGRLRSLVIVPTRELADQIQEVLTVLGRASGLRSATVFGGVAWAPQEKALRSADIIVACPGRLLAHLAARTASLSALEILVLDEADRLFDMGFLPSIRSILRHVPKDRQTMLFSATMPAEVRRLAAEALRDPVSIEVGEAAPVETVSHAIYPVSNGRKAALLTEILRRTEARSVLVFARTKRRAEALARNLSDAGRAATSLQGNLSQSERRRALDGFRRGEFDVLVATDLAARGIDVSRISHVINYDAPATADEYTHRVGRTGRATRSGDAFTLATEEDAALVWALEQVLGERLERRRIDGFEDRAPSWSAPARPGRAGFGRGPRRGASRGSGPAQSNGTRARRQWA